MSAAAASELTLDDLAGSYELPEEDELVHVPRYAVHDTRAVALERSLVAGGADTASPTSPSPARMELHRDRLTPATVAAVQHYTTLARQRGTKLVSPPALSALQHRIHDTLRPRRAADETMTPQPARERAAVKVQPQHRAGVQPSQARARHRTQQLQSPSRTFTPPPQAVSALRSRTSLLRSVDDADGSQRMDVLRASLSASSRRSDIVWTHRMRTVLEQFVGITLHALRDAGVPPSSDIGVDDGAVSSHLAAAEDDILNLAMPDVATTACVAALRGMTQQIVETLSRHAAPRVREEAQREAAALMQRMQEMRDTFAEQRLTMQQHAAAQQEQLAGDVAAAREECSSMASMLDIMAQEHEQTVARLQQQLRAQTAAAEAARAAAEAARVPTAVAPPPFQAGPAAARRPLPSRDAHIVHYTGAHVRAPPVVRVVRLAVQALAIAPPRRRDASAQCNDAVVPAQRTAASQTDAIHKAGTADSLAKLTRERDELLATASSLRAAADAAAAAHAQELQYARSYAIEETLVQQESLRLSAAADSSEELRQQLEATVDALQEARQALDAADKNRVGLQGVVDVILSHCEAATQEHGEAFTDAARLHAHVRALTRVCEQHVADVDDAAAGVSSTDAASAHMAAALARLMRYVWYARFCSLREAAHVSMDATRGDDQASVLLSLQQQMQTLVARAEMETQMQAATAASTHQLNEMSRSMLQTRHQLQKSRTAEADARAKLEDSVTAATSFAAACTALDSCLAAATNGTGLDVVQQRAIDVIACAGRLDTALAVDALHAVMAHLCGRTIPALAARAASAARTSEAAADVQARAQAAVARAQSEARNATAQADATVAQMREAVQEGMRNVDAVTARIQQVAAERDDALQRAQRVEDAMRRLSRQRDMETHTLMQVRVPSPSAPAAAPRSVTDSFDGVALTASALRSSVSSPRHDTSTFYANSVSAPSPPVPRRRSPDPPSIPQRSPWSPAHASASETTTQHDQSFYAHVHALASAHNLVTAPPSPSSDALPATGRRSRTSPQRLHTLTRQPLAHAHALHAPPAAVAPPPPPPSVANGGSTPSATARRISQIRTRMELLGHIAPAPLAAPAATATSHGAAAALHRYTSMQQRGGSSSAAAAASGMGRMPR